MANPFLIQILIFEILLKLFIDSLFGFIFFVVLVNAIELKGRDWRSCVHEGGNIQDVLRCLLLFDANSTAHKLYIYILIEKCLKMIIIS